jgi:hypothetical protein
MKLLCLSNIPREKKLSRSRKVMRITATYDLIIMQFMGYTSIADVTFGTILISRVVMIRRAVVIWRVVVIRTEITR